MSNSGVENAHLKSLKRLRLQYRDLKKDLDEELKKDLSNQIDSAQGLLVLQYQEKIQYLCYAKMSTAGLIAEKKETDFNSVIKIEEEIREIEEYLIKEDLLFGPKTDFAFYLAKKSVRAGKY